MTRAGKVYQTLCRVLERNEILHERNDRKLWIRCSIGSNAMELRPIFVIDPSKMLLSLYVPIEVGATWEQASELSFALCVINDALPDGHFCFDRRNMSVYFKMRSSFYDSIVSESVVEYMLSVAAEKAEEYCPKIRELTDVRRV